MMFLAVPAQVNNKPSLKLWFHSGVPSSPSTPSQRKWGAAALGVVRGQHGVLGATGLWGPVALGLLHHTERMGPRWLPPAEPQPVQKDPISPYKLAGSHISTSNNFCPIAQMWG